MTLSVTHPGKVWAHLDRIVRWQRGEKPAPVTLEWDLSNRCSLSCRDCHFGHLHSRGPLAHLRSHDTGDLADTQKVINVLAQVKHFGVQGVTWTGGGEPTLHPDFYKIVGVAHYFKLHQGLYTSGRHLNLVRHSGLLGEALDWCVFSVDHVTPQDYAHHKSAEALNVVLANMAKLAGTPCLVTASFLIDAGNWSTIPDMIALGRNHGAKKISLRPLITYDAQHPSRPHQDTAWIRDALPLLREVSDAKDVECSPERFLMLRDWPKDGQRPYTHCLGIRFNATITPDLRVWVCPNRRGMPDSCLGDLHKEAFATLWARHPGHWQDFANCRIMCRLHPVNLNLQPILRETIHKEFI